MMVSKMYYKTCACKKCVVLPTLLFDMIIIYLWIRDTKNCLTTVETVENGDARHFFSPFLLFFQSENVETSDIR